MPPPPLDESIAAPAPAAPATLSLAAYGLALATTPSADGVSITSVSGPAAAAGIAAGDVIEQLNGQNVGEAADLQTRLQALAKAKGAAILLISGSTAEGGNPGPRWVPLRAGS